VILRSLATLAVLLAGALAACGEREPVGPGAPAPPEAEAETDCESLGPGAAPVPAADPGEGLPYGFNDHAGLVGEIPVAENAALHERAGSTLWRVAIDWRFAEPKPGDLHLETHDAIYCEALARGVRPIFHITGAPAWAAAEAKCRVITCIASPRGDALAELTEFARSVAERYPGAAAIEAWNEPNLATFWAEPDPERYVEALAAINEGVKSADPQMPVLGGSLSNTTRTDVSRTDFVAFLRRMYNAGAARHMDGLAFHPYPVEPLGSDASRFNRSMAAVRRLAREPIWVTEVGIPVGGAVTEAQQSATMREIYERLSRDPRVRAAVFHTLVEAREEAGEGSGFGWLTFAGDELEPRPVYDEFAGG
jgi:polysaccharide biosynthesis protein PslG